MIIRIRSAAGFVRIEIEQHKTIFDLKKKIEESLNVPPEKQELFLTGPPKQLLKNDLATLKECEMENGCMVELKSDVRPVLIRNEKKKTESTGHVSKSIQKRVVKEIEKGKEKEKEKEKDKGRKKEKDKDKDKNESEKLETLERNETFIDKIMNKTNNESINKVSDKEKIQKSNENQPIFKSFDAFLKSRGYDTTDLPLNLSYKSIHITKGTMIRIPFSVTLKHQPYRHVDHLEFMNVKEVSNFVEHWCEVNNMLIQRGGWMYGYYKEDYHYDLGIRAVCECIYEPPQYDKEGEVIFKEDPFLKTVDDIADSLGLERIGLIYTHLPRKENITSSEIVSIAKLQLANLKNTHYTGYQVSSFVTCTISPDPVMQNEPLTNAFMISDLGMALLRDNAIAEVQTDPSHVELRNAEKNELLPQILEGGRETKKFDNDWLIVRVNESAPKVVRSIFKNTLFSVENRGTEQTAEDAKEYFKNPQLYKGLKDGSKYADFHLILFIAKVLGAETALTVCEAISQNKEVDQVIEEMITSYK